ncbi:MAG: hypothetical protein ACLVKK_07075 [Ruthenibacterium sp.]
MENETATNGIMRKDLKESFGNFAISLLSNNNLISSSKDLQHSVVEFGYLLIDSLGRPQAMFKLTIPKRLFHPQRTFYFGTQNGQLLLLNEQFTEEAFRAIQNDMFMMHGIDVDTADLQNYIMELY